MSQISHSSVQEEQDDDDKGETSYESPDPDPNDYPVLNQTFIQRRLNPRDKTVDRVFGPKPSADGSTWYIGDQVLTFLDNGDIKVGRRVFKGTRALYHFLFMKTMPRSYTEDDADAYTHILLLSSVHRKGFDPHQAIANTHLHKYKNVISPLFRRAVQRRRSQSGGQGDSTTTGEGYKLVTDQAKDYVYYSDPNELVDRLRLLVAAEQAGNNLDHHRNEMETILQELREIGIITN